MMSNIVNFFAPAKRDLLLEHPEENETYTYAFNRAWYSAYWGQIHMAYRLRKAGDDAPEYRAYIAFNDEVAKL